MANNTKGTLKYRKVKRIPPLGENAGKEKWYATVVTDRELSFEDFVNHISDHGSPTPADVSTVCSPTHSTACRSSSSTARASDSATWDSSPSAWPRRPKRLPRTSALRASRRCTSSCATPAPGATRSSARNASSRNTTPSALTALRPTRPALATTEAQAAPAPLAAPPPPEALAIQEALKAPEAATENRHPDS